MGSTLPLKKKELGHLDTWTWTLGHLDTWAFDTWTLGLLDNLVLGHWNTCILGQLTLGHLDTGQLDKVDKVDTWNCENTRHPPEIIKKNNVLENGPEDSGRLVKASGVTRDVI